MSAKEMIQGEVDTNDVVLFMKGNAQFPQCDIGLAFADVDIGGVRIAYNLVAVLACVPSPGSRK